MGGASSLGFNGSSDYVHPLGLAAVLVSAFQFGHFSFFPLRYDRVSLGESELQWIRVKVEVRVYKNTRCTNPTVRSDPASCLLSRREGENWTPIESTRCAGVFL